MCRTAVNTIGNLVGATWVARGSVALRVESPRPAPEPAR
jgi:Na+/H+-dicarboxylate symporter